MGGPETGSAETGPGPGPPAAGPEGDAGRGDGRRELAAFLRNRRLRLSPSDIGLPEGGRRRTPGLRREEVAVLAGLSPTWYSYLEQGRPINPSREVLDSLARVLRLNEDERRYIHLLAEDDGSRFARLEADVTPRETVEQLVDQFQGSAFPVYAADSDWNIVAWNPAAVEWYDDWDAMPRVERNLLRWLLTSPLARERLVDWEQVARDTIARWRAELARQSVVGSSPMAQTLAALSPEFRRWWADHDVLEHRSALRRFRHPDLGVQTMRVVPLLSPELFASGITVHLPVHEEQEPR